MASRIKQVLDVIFSGSDVSVFSPEANARFSFTTDDNFRLPDKLKRFMKYVLHTILSELSILLAEQSRWYRMAV